MNYLMKKKEKFILTIVFMCCAFFTKKTLGQQFVTNYPKLNSQPSVDIYFGQKIIDKYRVLENIKNSTVLQWIKEERKLYDSISKLIPQRDSLEKKLEDVIYSSNVRGGFPRVTGKKIFFFRSFVREKLQAIFYKSDLNSKEIELFNTKSINEKDKTYNIDYYEPSFDGKYIALGISVNGDEMSVIRIINVETKKFLPESIERATYGTPFWIPGKDGFFYAQLKEMKSDEDFKTKYEDNKVMLHWLNSDSKNDKEIFSRKLNNSLQLDKIDIPFICTFPNSDKVLAFTFHGSTPYLSLYYASLNDLINTPESISWRKASDSDDNVSTFALNNNQLYVLSFKDNPNGVVRRVELGKKISEGTILLEGKGEVLEDLIQTPNFLYIKKLKNGNSNITSVDFSNNSINTVKLPYDGYAYIKPNFGTPPVFFNSNDLFFGIESWNREFGVYSYNPEQKQTIKTDLRAQGKYGNPTDILVKDIEVPSHDGVMVPLTIVYSKNIKLNGRNPTLIEGYGAYGVSMNATFDLPLLVWLRMGGIYAVAHVRGGGEKGDDWYKGGYKLTKSNSWKDFIACSEYLIRNKYTAPKFLAAKGVSAGGITAGRAITERPDLFKAAVIDVGKLNSLRSENSSNSLSVSEYGTVKDSAEFKSILDMDVYHHIKENINYPSLLITAALKDARVDWWQPGKAVARFQDVSDGKNNIVLFKITDNGHFGTADKLKDALDEYSFLLWQLKR